MYAWLRYKVVGGGRWGFGPSYTKGSCYAEQEVSPGEFVVVYKDGSKYIENVVKNITKHATDNRDKIETIEVGTGVECPLSPLPVLLESKYGVFLRGLYEACIYHEYDKWKLSDKPEDVPVVALFTWAHRKCSEAEMDEVRTVCDMTPQQAVQALFGSEYCLTLELVMYVENHWVFDPPTAFARDRDGMELFENMSDFHKDGVQIMSVLQGMFQWTPEEAAANNYGILRNAVGDIPSEEIELPENVLWIIQTYKIPKEAKYTKHYYYRDSYVFLHIPMTSFYKETLKIIQDHFEYTREEIDHTFRDIAHNNNATKSRGFLLSISGV